MYFLTFSLAKGCANNNKEPEYVTRLKKLLEDLCPSSKKPPAGNNTVYVFMDVRRISFEADKEVFTTQTNFNVTWRDERLKWDPDKYHGIKETEIGHFLGWIPKFELINVAKFLNQVSTFHSCKIYNTGVVTCRYRMLYEIRCGVKLTNWPYDVQECSLEFSYEYMTVNLRTGISGEYTAGWHVSEIKQENNASGKPGVTVTLVLVREAAGLSAIFIYPALVLTVLNIVTLFLDVRRNVRLAVGCFTLFGHYYLLMQLDIDMPKGNAFTPTILLYYRDSIILTIITILLTFFLTKLCSVSSKPHNYIKIIKNFVCDNKYSNYFVFPKWESDDVTVDFKSSNEDYVIFANVVNSVFMFLIVFAYFGLFISKIPK
ncbi:neuronal acetylcholine receptor subunit beta-2-like [Spodoptera litura]|uniref:Neuronal acetylcholine receptor subunit beta-2-like n=1 Tax=Spodoptera litura TaxID=69820 RepID=A0A9J7E3H3_SPOLT|nr:neuronal acetylcholine receptor subunit beta-2-like [Spodoptera litura]